MIKGFKGRPKYPLLLVWCAEMTARYKILVLFTSKSKGVCLANSYKVSTIGSTDGRWSSEKNSWREPTVEEIVEALNEPTEHWRRYTL